MKHDKGNNLQIDDSAKISQEAVIGFGTKIWQYCIIQKASIGKECNIGANVYIEDHVKIGNGVKIKNNVAIYSGVECEDDVFLGPNCVFTNVINPRSFIERKDEFRKTIIRKGATVGANATIVCGHEIGEYAMIGAGAVVTKDVSPYTLVVGNPARMSGYVCKCGERIVLENDKGKCKKCERYYVNIHGKIEQIKE